MKRTKRGDRRSWHYLRSAALACMIGVLLALAGVAGVGAAQSPEPTIGNLGSGRTLALLAVFLDDPGRLDQARAAGLTLYSHLASEQGDLLLVGSRLDAADGALSLPFPARVLDVDTTGATYYVAHAPNPGHASFGPITWADYGRVLLDLGDQVVLRATPDQAERLPEAGAQIARISLDPKPWLAAAAAETAAVAPEAVTPDALVQQMIDQVTTSTLQTYLNQLSGQVPVTFRDGTTYTIGSRYTYSGSNSNNINIQRATQFVREHLEGLGLNVETYVWDTQQSGKPAPSTYPNVIGERAGNTNPTCIYVIGAHMDDMPSSGSAPGADDNGSGTVATLMAADILTKYDWGCTLRFALWTGEEQGMRGSAAYAKRAKGRGENIRGYLNMDMLGYNASAPNEIDLFSKSSVAGSNDMMNLFGGVISAYGLNLVPTYYPDDSLGNQSDNKSFWDQGYASILSIEDYYGDFTPVYHTSNDKPSTLNWTYYTDFVKASVATFGHLNMPLIYPDESDLAPSYGLAWHTGRGALRLGAAWTGEASNTANGDNASDDGIALRGDTNWGDGTASVQASVTGGDGCLSGWMDKYQDGAFDAGDLVIDRAQVLAGTQEVSVNLGGFTLPNTSVAYNMRFRLTPRDLNNSCAEGAYGSGLVTAAAPALLGAPQPTGWADGARSKTGKSVLGRWRSPLAASARRRRAMLSR